MLFTVVRDGGGGGVTPVGVLVVVHMRIAAASIHLRNDVSRKVSDDGAVASRPACACARLCWSN